MRVSAESLHRLFYNVKQWQGSSGTPAHIYGTHLGLGIIYMDQHVLFRDFAEGKTDEPAEEPFHFVVSDARPFESALRKPSGIDVEIRLDDVKQVVVSIPDGPEWVGATLVVPERSTDDRIKDEANAILMDLDARIDIDGPFMINRDRFRKLSLMKPGDHPADLVLVDHSTYGDLILFRIGPTIDGALTLMDRDVVHKANSDWMW